MCGLYWVICRSTQTLWVCLACVWEFFLPPSKSWKCLVAQGCWNGFKSPAALFNKGASVWPCRWWYEGVGCPAMELPLEWVGNSHRQSLGAIQANYQTLTQFSRAKFLLCLYFMCMSHWTDIYRDIDIYRYIYIFTYAPQCIVLICVYAYVFCAIVYNSIT